MWTVHDDLTHDRVFVLFLAARDRLTMGAEPVSRQNIALLIRGIFKGCCLYNTPVEHGQFSKTPNKFMQHTRYCEPLMGGVRLLKKETR